MKNKKYYLMLTMCITLLATIATASSNIYQHKRSIGSNAPTATHLTSMGSSLSVTEEQSGPHKAETSTILLVNEIQVANIDEFIDPSYNYGGWIELYNTSNNSISLNNYYISDDPNNLKRYRLSSAFGSIPAKGYKVLWFDHNSADGSYGSNASKQIRFKLDADGGTIYLSDNSGNLILQQEYPEAISRCSYARTTDGGDTWRWTSTPSPDATNVGSSFADEQLPVPEIDLNSGILTSSTKLSVTIPEGTTLRYTSNGSTPTLTNGFTLGTNGTIYVSSTNVLRFRAYKEGYLPSPVVTRTYIFPGDKSYNLPIVSVATDNKNLYDNIIGVYTDGTNGMSGRGVTYKSNKNMDWERPVNFEYIGTDGQCKLNQEATFYISGGWSRHWAPTSFKIKAEKRYDGLNSLNYPFFEEKPYNKHKCIVMRNGGNDTGCRVKDAIIQHIIQSSGLYLDGQAFNPCHVFLNGKYLAMLNMREPSNKFFAFSNYGIDTDAMDAFELSGGYVVRAGSSASMTNLVNLANNVNSEGVYQNIIDEYLDIDEYINYMAAECWLGSTDWLTNNNNCKGFRAIDNGRYHFVMFDTDAAFGNNSMLSSLKNSNANKIITLFNRMAKNPEFQKQFVTAYCLIAGSVFTPERAQASANYIGDLTNAALALDNRSPWGSCNEVVNAVSNTSSRNARMNSLKNYFALSTGMNVSLNANIDQAQLLVNGRPVPTNKFSGTLYAPVTLEASAPAGYNFVGWRDGSAYSATILPKGSMWNYYDKGSLDGTNWKTGDISWSVGYAPLGYGNMSFKTTLSYGSNSNNKYPTYYFRRKLNISSPLGNDEKITMNFAVDDGFIIYINGVEAGRYLMPTGPVNFNTYATTYAPGNPDTGSMELPVSLFKEGENIIAVEVHNNSGSSTDIYFDAEFLRIGTKGNIVISERKYELTTNADHNITAIFEPIPEECLLQAGSAPVVVNEVSAGNSVFVNEYYKKNDWIELYNTTSQPIDVAGMYLSDNPNNPEKYQIDAEGMDINTVIPPHGHLVIWADKLDPMLQLHTNFKLGNSDGECVTLTAADGSWTDCLEYIAHNGDESVGRYPDGGKRVFKMSLPTIGKTNTITSYAQWLSGEDENFDVEGFFANVDAPNTSAKATKVEYFTIDGIRLNAPQHGVNIMRTTNSNGTVETKKILIH